MRRAGGGGVRARRGPDGARAARPGRGRSPRASPGGGRAASSQIRDASDARSTPAPASRAWRQGRRGRLAGCPHPHCMWGLFRDGSAIAGALRKAVAVVHVIIQCAAQEVCVARSSGDGEGHASVIIGGTAGLGVALHARDLHPAVYRLLEAALCLADGCSSHGTRFANKQQERHESGAPHLLSP